MTRCGSYVTLTGRGGLSTVAIIAIAACMSGCGTGSQSAPSATSPSPAAPIATLNIGPFSASVVPGQSRGFIYQVSFQIRETSGQSGASVTSAKLTFQDGRITTVASAAGQTIGAGGTLTTNPFIVTDLFGMQPTTDLMLTVAYTDDGGRAGTTNGVTSVAQPETFQRFTVSGDVFAAATNQPIARAIVRIVGARAAACHRQLT